MTRISVIVLCTTFLAAPTHAGEHRNFVSCPLVRDTKTVPCWLAEHDGELYYLGIQTDISADFDPPYLGHRALVEGVVAPNAERICGGIVLDPVNVSTLPELDGACNTVLPAEDRYQVPFAPRPPGPSGGRLAFEPPPGAAAAKPALTGPQEFAIEYDFDTPIMARHADVLTQIFGYATQAHARHIVVRGYRGATLLSDGTVMTERDTLPEARAKEVAQLLIGAGLPRAEIEVIAEYVEPISCLVAPTHEYANRSELTLDEICKYHLALPEHSFGLRQVFERAIAKRRLNPQILVTTNSLELTKTMAATGQVIAFMPALTVIADLALGGLRAVSISDPDFAAARSCISVHRDRPLSHAAQQFLKLMAASISGLSAGKKGATGCGT